MCAKRIKKEYYATYDQAKAAARALNCKTVVDYGQKRKLDPGLHAMPNWFYRDKGWQNWDDFLGREPKKKKRYETYEEARQAARKLNCRTISDYQRERKKDPLLSCNPQYEYRNKGWKEWDDFLGREPKPKREYYKTYEAAKNGARKLKIEFVSYYPKRYKEDPHLPCDPSWRYRDAWVDWYDFLGIEKPKLKKRKKKKAAPLGPLNTQQRYFTYDEARQKVRQMGIKNATEYNEKCAGHQKFPALPGHTYKRNGWNGWRKFLGLDE